MRKTVGQIIEWLGGEWLGDTDTLEELVMGVSTDTRTLEHGCLFVPIIGEQFDGHKFLADAVQKGARMALCKRDHTIQPPENSPILLVADPLESLQRLAQLYLKQVGCKVVGITGSNGKTTTKDMIASILRVKYRTHANVGNLNNEIGLPLTILAMPEDTEIAVLEMGMNHFGEIDRLTQIATPDIAVITNIGDSHIAHLGSRAGIATAKLEILNHMSEDGVFIYPAHEPLVAESDIVRQFKGQKLTPALKVVENYGTKGLLLEDEHTHEQYQLPIPGIHNAQNAAYALAVGTFLHMRPSEIREGFLNMSLSKMRMQLLEGQNGVTIINDAYNASLVSMRAALRFMAELQDWKHKVVVLGDIGEVGEFGPSIHTELGTELNPEHFPTVFVTGELSRYIVEGAMQAGYMQVKHIETKEQLIAELQPYLTADTIILFKASRFMELERVIHSLV